jgi:hypothetical protein
LSYIRRSRNLLKSMVYILKKAQGPLVKASCLYP